MLVFVTNTCLQLATINFQDNLFVSKFKEVLAVHCHLRIGFGGFLQEKCYLICYWSYKTLAIVYLSVWSQLHLRMQSHYIVLALGSLVFEFQKNDITWHVINIFMRVDATHQWIRKEQLCLLYFFTIKISYLCENILAINFIVDDFASKYIYWSLSTH